MFTVRTISPEETRPLRHLVLWPHIPFEKDCVIDIDHREDAIHLGTFDNEKLVSVGSLFRVSSPKLSFTHQYRLRAMASHPDYRGQDCGKMLVQEAMGILRQKSIQVLWCDAREKAVGFYARIGFSVLEEVYDVPLIGPHKFMWIEL